MLQSLHSSTRAACRTPARRAAPFRGTAARNVPHTGSVVCRSGSKIMDDADRAKMKELEERFRSADVDGNGFIDREELRQLLESCSTGQEVLFSQHWMPEEELDAAMERYDTNKDGVISLEEFKQLAYDGILLEGTLTEYEEAFRAVDSSGNGTVGATELAGLFQKLGHPMSLEELVEVMQKYDKDESGQIEFSEFLLMFRDKLLDLKAMSEYMTMMPESLDAPPSGAQPSGAVIEPVEGNLTLLFSEAELDELSAKASREGKALLVFAALTWCRPCKAMQRPVQKMAEHYRDGLIVAKLFGNANSRTKALFKERFEIRSTPCFIALVDGKVVYTQTGANKEKLEAGLRTAIPHAKQPATLLYPSPDAPALSTASM